MEDNTHLIKAIISLMPGHVYWKNIHGIYLGCNDEQARTLGFSSAKEIIGKTDGDLPWKEDAPVLHAIDQKVIHTEQSFEVEESVTMPDGRKATFLSKKVPLYNHAGEVIGILGVSFDITERKRAEEELKEAKEKAEIANQAKTQFLAVMSHELRVPLTGVISTASMLASGSIASPDEVQQTGKMMLDAGTYLLSNITSTLDFSKLEACKFEMIQAPFDLKSLIEEVVVLLMPSAKAKGLDLLMTYEPHTPHNLVSDPRALRQIVINLINNAIKYTEKGYIRINVFSLGQTPQSVKLKITVEDTGIGIPKDKFEFIFDRFSQVETTYVRRTSRSGIGLGLSIVKKLAELLHGHLEVNSGLGKGSQFSLTAEFRLQTKAIKEMPWLMYASKVRLLVVDDTFHGDILCKHMGLINCDAVGGADALATLLTAQQLEQPYDIVVMDEQLSSENPYVLLRDIKHQKGLRKPMVVLLTATQGPHEQAHFHKNDYFLTLTKPIQPIAFQTVMTSAWEEWSEMHLPTKNHTSKKIHGLKILLVEDDVLVQRIHHRMFTALGCEVDVAETGAQALIMATSGIHYHLFFIDIGLPDIDGYEVIKTLRQHERVGTHYPIIALTGYTLDEEKQACLDAGANEIISKPVVLATLEEVLGRYSSIS